MKGPIEILNELHQTGKERPDVYDAVEVHDKVIVAAIVDLSKQLDHFNQSKQDKISPAQIQAMSNELTRGALASPFSNPQERRGKWE
jgi:hypothetical protein